MTLKLSTGKAPGLPEIALCGSLLLAPWLSPFECQAQLPAATLPDASPVAQSAQPDLVGLPSAPEPNIDQAGGTSQNPPSRQSQTDKQDQSKPATAPSLGDLGFTPQQTQADAKLQALLDRRSHMLKVHQRLGLIAALPMAAALITGPMAKAKGRNGQPITEPTNANLDFHAALGGVTAGLYYTSVYYAMFAPKVPETKRRGAIRMHEALAWIHGPGMILTPILGIMAYKQENAGEKVHGIASAHGAVAWATAIAYGTAIVSVSWPIKIKF